MTVTDASVQFDNIIEIQYNSTEEYERRKGRAIYELTHNLLSETSKFDIEYIDTEPPTLNIKRQLIVKVYKDRSDCPIGGLAQNKDEPDHYLTTVNQNLQARVQKYSVFVIEGKLKTHFYWVRTE